MLSLLPIYFELRGIDSNPPEHWASIFSPDPANRMPIVSAASTTTAPPQPGGTPQKRLRPSAYLEHRGID